MAFTSFVSELYIRLGKTPLSPLLLQMVLAYHILVSIVIESIPRESKNRTPYAHNFAKR